MTMTQLTNHHLHHYDYAQIYKRRSPFYIGRKGFWVKCIAICFMFLILSVSFLYPVEFELSKEVRQKVEQIKKWAVVNHFDADSIPRGVHISRSDSPSAVSVLWLTKHYSDTYAFYGLSQNNLNNTAQGRCEKLEFIDRKLEDYPYHHILWMNNLKPNAQYFYRVQSNGVTSRLFEFRTWPLGMNWSPTFLVYGDLGAQSYSFPYIADEIRENFHDYNAVLHLGDIAYDLDNKGDEFLRMIEPVAARVPYMTCPGDHERRSEFLHYRYKFAMPAIPWPMPLYLLWYSFTAGPARIISINTEVYQYDLDNIPSQLSWLRNELKIANKNRNTHPWVIVIGHRPFYCSNNVPLRFGRRNCNHFQMRVRLALEPLFQKYGVDIALFGHEHSYERFWPIYNLKVLNKSYENPDSPVYMTIGSMVTRFNWAWDGFPNSKPPDWSAFRWPERADAFGKLEIKNRTHAHWEVFEVSTSESIDSIWIVQNRHGPFPTPEPITEEYLEPFIWRKKLSLPYVLLQIMCSVYGIVSGITLIGIAGIVLLKNQYKRHQQIVIIN